MPALYGLSRQAEDQIDAGIEAAGNQRGYGICGIVSAVWALEPLKLSVVKALDSKAYTGYPPGAPKFDMIGVQ